MKKTEERRHSGKKIAFYIGSLKKGGAERVFVNLAEYFYKTGYQVTMVTQYTAENEYVISKGIERVISDLSDSEISDNRIVNFHRRTAKLRRIWRTVRPDLILSCIGKNNFMAVVTTLFSKIKVVVSIVGEPTEEYNSTVMRVLAKVLFIKADGIVLQTEDSKVFFPQYLLKKSVILQNSLNPLFIQDRYEGVRDRQIVSVGRLDANKNQTMLIEAFARIAVRYPEYSVVCYGDGKSRAQLEALIERFNLQGRVQLPGITTDVAGMIRKASVFVLTSYTEGMPNALIEAMALGLPVISTDCPCGGPKELIRQGENGMLIPVGDVEALAASLVTLLEDTEFMEKLGRSAARIQDRLNPERTNQQWKEYFELILHQRS